MQSHESLENLNNLITDEVIRKIINKPVLANHYCKLLSNKGIEKNRCSSELLKLLNTTESNKTRIRNEISPEFKDSKMQEYAKRKGEGESKFRTLKKKLKKMKDGFSSEDWERALIETHIIQQRESELKKNE